MILKTRQKKNRHIKAEDFLGKPVLNNSSQSYNLHHQRMQNNEDTYTIGHIIEVSDLGEEYELTIELLDNAFTVRATMFVGQPFEFSIVNKNPQA